MKIKSITREEAGVKAENLKDRQKHGEEPALAGKKPGTRRRTVTCRAVSSLNSSDLPDKGTHTPSASQDAHTREAWKHREEWNC